MEQNKFPESYSESKEELIAQMMEVGIFQWEPGHTSPDMRKALKLLNFLKERGVIEDDESLNWARIGAISIILSNEIDEVDIAEDLTSNAQTQIEDFRNAS